MADIKKNFHNVDLYFDGNFSLNALTPQQIGEVEGRMGFRFPPIFEEYYLKFNGYQLIDKCCFKHYKSYVKLHCLYELNATIKDLDFEDIFYCGDNEFWPKKLIPFGCDEGGREFCFSIAFDDFGAIYFHDSERTGEPEETQFLAKDFLSFLAALRPESDFE